MESFLRLSLLFIFCLFYFKAEINVYCTLLIILRGGQIGGQTHKTDLQYVTN